ncbi:MAG: DUF4469 domain-containing protein [Spirochaetaceae bacterium]|jgi:hypothetical protein|nr:DUF4469 domain-containing protein [Spirochaetaceae bacterium]
MHRVTAKFVHAFLPDAQKPYYLRAVFQPELDIHVIAGKAAVYNIETDPAVIERGLTDGLALIYYLAADGCKIKTPVFTLSIRLPGEYDGTETSLPEGVYPEARLQANPELRRSFREHVQVQLDGVGHTDGLLAEAVDEATGMVDETATIGNLLDIRGYGLKIAADAADAPQAGLFFDDGETALVKAVLAINEPRTLKAVVSASLTPGKAYTLKVVTQSRAQHGSGLLKDLREVRSEFRLTIQPAHRERARGKA